MQNKEALIGVIGLGYVGLPLSLSYAENKIRVLGFDIDKNKISTINNGKSYFQHITNKRIKENIDKNLLHATNDFSKISELDAIIICVPTPLTKNKEPDLSFIKNTLSSILKYLRPGQILSLESTTYPGTTEEVLMPLIVSKGFEIGKDFF